MNTGADPSWDGDLFRMYNKRWSAESWQDDFVGEARAYRDTGGDPHLDSYDNDSAGEHERGLFGGPGADLFGSDFATRQSNGQRPEGPDESYSDNSPMSGSMPAISQSMAGFSQSMPSVSGSTPQLSSADVTGRSETHDTGSLVRPYARTRGRTRTDYDLAIETLVSTSEHGRAHTSPATPEHRSICGLCQEARSVAEVAAHLRLPLGVVRVLIGDMAGLGLVLIHDSGMVVGDRPSMEFLERVLSGLRRL